MENHSAENNKGGNMTMIMANKSINDHRNIEETNDDLEICPFYPFKSCKVHHSCEKWAW